MARGYVKTRENIWANELNNAPEQLKEFAEFMANKEPQRNQFLDSMLELYESELDRQLSIRLDKDELFADINKFNQFCDYVRLDINFEDKLREFFNKCLLEFVDIQMDKYNNSDIDKDEYIKQMKLWTYCIKDKGDE